jgi:NitT/TauT family transport system substrate-binding protein
MKKSMTLLAIVSFLLAGMTGCGRDEDTKTVEAPVPIRIAVTPWPGSAPLYIAREKGYFEEEGIDATLDSYISGHLGLDAVLSGNADLATVGDTPIARAAVDGRPLAVVATISKVDRAISIIARKDKGISSAGDLRGKKIGRVEGTTADFFLYILLTASYIDPGKVQLAPLHPEGVVDALFDGQVDAVSTWAPHTAVLRDKLGDNALVLNDPSIYTMTWNIVAARDLVKNNPGTIEKFLRAILKANAFIAKEPDETQAVCSKQIGIEGPLFEREWKDYHFAVSLDEGLVLNIEDQARWMLKKETGGVRIPSNLIDLFYTGGLKAVSPEAVRIAGR